MRAFCAAWAMNVSAVASSADYHRGHPPSGRVTLCETDVEIIMRIYGWVGIALLAHGSAAPAAETENYPSRPIRVLLPQAPGSTTDTLGRVVFAATAERIGQQLVVDNRAGAGGTLGMEIGS